MRTERQVERDNRNAAPLISVIVPIYNVERYVRKCLDSLVAQTLREIEVICIDDGSTDSSGQIAEEYAGIHDGVLFRIIHTENRGLSAARNRGIEESRADWLMFVDGDDWVDQKFCELPYDAAIENQADLVCFRAYRVTRLGRIKKTGKTDTATGIVTKITAHEYGGVVAWNKLYRKKLFDAIRYPVGNIYEDRLTTHKVVNESKTTFILDALLYYYVDRKGSITNCFSEDNRKKCFLSSMERYNALCIVGYPEDKLMPQLCSSALGFLASSGQKEDELHTRAEKIVDSVEQFPESYPFWKKLALATWKVDKRLFYMIGRVSGRHRSL